MAVSLLSTSLMTRVTETRGASTYDTYYRSFANNDSPRARVKSGFFFFFFFFLLPFDSLRDEIVTERKERKKGRKRGGEKERENERERESRSTRALVKGKTSRGRLPLAIRSVSVSIDPREE